MNNVYIDDFWNTVDALRELEDKQRKLEEHLREKINRCEQRSQKIQKMKKMGFSMVILRGHRVAFIDYSKERVDGRYYEVIFHESSNKVFYDTMYPPSPEDLKLIREILDISE